MGKSIAVFVGIFLLQTLTSCCLGDCCGDGGGGKFRFENFELTTYVATSGSDLNYDQLSVADSGEEMNWNQLVLKIDPAVDHISYLNFSGGFSSSYACSPAPPSPTSRVINIAISSNQDYNEDYPAGSNLIELFDEYHFYSKRKTPLQEYWVDNYEFFIVLNEAPLETKEHVLRIYIELENETHFLLETPSLTINS